MSTYRVAINHNVALGSLSLITPQPRSPGVQVMQQDFLADGSVDEQGLYVELTWSVLPSASAYQSVLALFGLSSGSSRSVTIYCKSQRLVWTRYNGTAILPTVTYERARVRNVVMLVKDLRPLP